MAPFTNTKPNRIWVAIAASAAFASLAPRARADEVPPPAPAAAPAPATPPAAPPASPAGADSAVNLGNTIVEAVGDQTSILPTKPTESVGGIAQIAQDIPRSLTEITPAQFQNDVIQTYNDFQKYSPSVTANTGAIGNYGAPTIRGALSDVYQDGIRTMARQSNEHPFDINAYESADVVAGPASVIFGPSARTSGYVNYQTKEPYTDQQHTTVNLNVGQYVAGGAGYHQADNVQVDTGAPITSQLAYRVSFQEEDSNSYYQYAYDRYQDLYGALNYRTKSGVVLDLNADYGYFTYNNPGGYNRVTQSLLDSGEYLAGVATPIIKDGSTYYSPVVGANGQFSTTPTFIVRTPGSTVNGAFVAGAKTNGTYTAYQATATPYTPPAGTAGYGTVTGWVLGPNVAPVKVNGDQGLTNNNNAPLITKEFAGQFRASKEISPDTSIQNNAYYEFFFNDTAVNGGTYNWINDTLFEDRFEYRHKSDFKLLGQDVVDDSNTGITFRFEQVLNYKDSDPTAVTAGGDQFDLTGNPSAITRNALFDATVYPLPYANRYVNSPIFGPLLFATPSVPNPNDAEFSVTPGGGLSGLSTTTNHTWTQELGLYSQHSIAIGDHWIYDIGARLTGVTSKIADPLVDPTDPTSVNADTVDHISALIPSVESSLEYKPIPRLTLYDTYDYVQARNGMTTGSVTWAGGGQNDLTAKAFHSVSENFEEGFKSEVIPGTLFLTADYYHQTREQTVGTDANGDPVLGLTLYRGLETSLRYQASKQFDVGANYTYISANDVNVAVSTEPIVADNTTSFQGSTASAPAGGYLIADVPHQNLTVYGDYRFVSGFGVSPSVSAHSWEVYNYTSATTHNTIPGKYTANLTLFFNRPSWKVSLDILNLTNQTDFAGNLPTEPLAIQGRFTLRL